MWITYSVILKPDSHCSFSLYISSVIVVWCLFFFHLLLSVIFWFHVCIWQLNKNEKKKRKSVFTGSDSVSTGCWAGGVSTSAALTKHLSVSIPLTDLFQCHRFFMREFSSAVVSMEAVFVCLCSELLLLSWLLLLSASSPLTQEGVAWHVKPQWCNNWQRIFMESQVFVEDYHASAAHILHPVLSTVSHMWCRTALTLNTQTNTLKLKQP